MSDMTFRETIPPGVNSDWPKSHSRKATRRYLRVKISNEIEDVQFGHILPQELIHECAGEGALAAVLWALNDVHPAEDVVF
jgi:hypothetical protein